MSTNYYFPERKGKFLFFRIGIIFTCLLLTSNLSFAEKNAVQSSATFTISALNSCPDVPITITFTGSYTGTAAFVWDFAGADILSGTDAGPYIISFPSTHTSTQTITLSMTDDNGTTNFSKGVYIYGIPSLVITKSHATIRDGCVTKLTPSNGSSYGTWSPALPVITPPGLPALTYPEVYVQPVANTTYTLTGLDIHGCPTSGSTTLTIAPTPTTNFTVPVTELCTTSYTTYMSIDAGSTLGNMYSSPAGLVISGMEIWANISTPGVYTIYNQITNPVNNPYGFNCPAIPTSSHQLTVYKQPIINSFTYPNPGDYCSTLSGVKTPTFGLANSGTVQFSATPAGLTLNTTTGAITLDNSSAGNYTVVATASNGMCPTVSSQRNVTIQQQPSTMNFSYNNAYCLTGSTPDPMPVMDPGAVKEYFSANPSYSGVINSQTGAFSISGITTLMNNINFQNSSQITFTVTNIHYPTTICPGIQSTPVQVIFSRSKRGKPFNYSGGTYRICAPITFPAIITPIIDPNAYGVMGTFSASPAGLSISPSGAIDVNQSLPGTYTVAHNAAQNPGCTDNPPVQIITILPMPVLSPATVQACSGQPFSHTFVANPATGLNAFSWTAALTSGTVTGYSSSMAITTLSQTLTGSGTVVYTATAQTSAGCNSASAQITVQVSPIPVVTPITNKTICGNNPLSVPLASSNVPTANLSWTSSTASATIGGYTNGTAATITDMLTNTGSSGTVNYIVTASKNGCSGTTSFNVTVNPSPVISSTLSTTNPCPHETVSYTYTRQSGFTYAHSSSFQIVYTGQPTTTSTVVVGMPAMVDGTFGLTVTNPSNSCSTSETKNITVKPVPLVSASSATVCAGSSFDIGISSNDPLATYNWSATYIPSTVTRVPVSGTGTHIAATPEGNGTVVYAVQAIGGNGCATYIPVMVNAVVNPNPVHIVSVNPTTVCEGSSVGISITTNGNPFGFIYTYTTPPGFIYQGGGGGSSGFGASWKASATSGNFTVTTTNSTTGCGRVTNYPVTVIPAPPTPVVTASPLTGCQGTTGSFSVATAPAVGHSWVFQNGATSGTCGGNGTSSGCTYTFASTSANLIVTATSIITGCTSNSIVGLVGKPNPIVNPVSPPMLCSGSTSNILLTSDIAGSTYSWTASLDSGSTIGFAAGSGSSIQQILTGVGAVKYQVTASKNGCTGPPRAINQYVSQNFPVSVSITSNPATSNVATVNATFTANVTNGGTSPSYQWKLNGVNVGTNSPTYTKTNFGATTHTSGDYVECVVTSNTFCAVNNPATSVQKRIYCSVCREGTFVEEAIEKPEGISIYPNPFSGHLMLQIPDNSGTAEITITDTNGKEVEKLTTGNKYEEIGHRLPAGLYILKVMSSSGIKTFKITKTN